MTTVYIGKQRYPMNGCTAMARGLVRLSASTRCDVPFSSFTNIRSFLLFVQYSFLSTVK